MQIYTIRKHILYIVPKDCISLYKQTMETNQLATITHRAQCVRSIGVCLVCACVLDVAIYCTLTVDQLAIALLVDVCCLGRPSAHYVIVQSI